MTKFIVVACGAVVVLYFLGIVGAALWLSIPAIWAGNNNLVHLIMAGFGTALLALMIATLAAGKSRGGTVTNPPREPRMN